MSLPDFPVFRVKPTEDQFERTVEKLVDRVDAAFMAGKVTAADYDQWFNDLRAWEARNGR